MQRLQAVALVERWPYALADQQGAALLLAGMYCAACGDLPSARRAFRDAVAALQALPPAASAAARRLPEARAQLALAVVAGGGSTGEALEALGPEAASEDLPDFTMQACPRPLQIT